MKSAIMKRSIILNGHKTSISLEETFLDGLKEIAGLQEKTVTGLVEDIDNQRHNGSLSSAIRLFVLSHYQGQVNSE
ncbi:MAG: ribbon-helix-helix domain-containing protein [Solirubrobacteraceae bacterium]|nr:ribbon-helix-helix domain-containing protein [Solirubrobacteraceae bacterium]